MALPATITLGELPGLNCGVCGLRSCEEMVVRAADNPELIKRCIYLSDNRFEAGQRAVANQVSASAVSAPAAPMIAQPVVSGPAMPLIAQPVMSTCAGCAPAGMQTTQTGFMPGIGNAWCDTLGREFDFYLEHFPEEPGPREIILPHNPLITREMDIQVGDIMIGRPLGMSCGCPITHCGVAMEVDKRTGVIVWCVTGPLNPRQKGFKDLGYYIAEGYEGLITQARTEVRIGMRYYFQPRMCMLQWRHSGLVNFMNQTPTGLQVRVEGLWIG